VMQSVDNATRFLDFARNDVRFNLTLELFNPLAMKSALHKMDR
jgi:hypothetical protein